MAAFRVADVTVPPETVAQADVMHWLRVLLMLGDPALDQLIARDGSRTPDHGYCPYNGPETLRRQMTKTMGEVLNLINSPAESKSSDAEVSLPCP
jgi:hypothetical protein